jgi:hypothetical protein
MFNRRKKSKPLVSEDEVSVEELLLLAGATESETVNKPRAWASFESETDADRVRILEAAIRAHMDIGRATYQHSPKGTIELIPRHVHETLWSVLDD